MITIIMPYFRKRKYVKQSVNSILRQTYKNFELILIYDDHVKDDVKFIITSEFRQESLSPFKVPLIPEIDLIKGINFSNIHLILKKKQASNSK